MLSLLQIINHMLVNLEYSVSDIDDTFTAIINKDFSVEELLDVVGMEIAHPAVLERLKNAIPKYESALKIIELRNEA